MIISEKNHSKIFNTFLVVIASLMIFRVLCTIVLLMFVVYNLLNLEKIKTTKSLWFLVLFISSPLLINIIFIWNNDSLYAGLKAIEKYLALLFLPVFIIGNYRYISIYSLLKKYCIVLSIILIIMLVKYIIFSPELFYKYVNGIHMWEMGYSFTNSFGNHAPAINMHVSFAIMSVFFLLTKALEKEIKNKNEIILYVLIFMTLFFFLLYINTRLALINTIFGLAIILGSYGLKNKKSVRALLVTSLTLLIIGGSITIFIYKNPYMIKKYTVVTFANMDKIGRLDEIDNVQAVAYNSLVTRLTIWKTAINLGLKQPIIGYGAAESKNVLFDYYKETKQYFLHRNELPVHNQLIDFFLKFGIFGIIIFGMYMFNVFYIGYKLKNPLILSFFVLFFISNMSDDFLIRFDGIVYSGFWISIFASSFVKVQNDY